MLAYSVLAFPASLHPIDGDVEIAIAARALAINLPESKYSLQTVPAHAPFFRTRLIGM